MTDRIGIHNLVASTDLQYNDGRLVEIRAYRPNMDKYEVHATTLTQDKKVLYSEAAYMKDCCVSYYDKMIKKYERKIIDHANSRYNDEYHEEQCHLGRS